MPLVIFNPLKVYNAVTLPDVLMQELFFKAKKDNIRHFPSVFVDAKAEHLGLDWRMPADADYLQITIED